MDRTLTFIHAADLHLGAPVRGLAALSPGWAERVSRAVEEAYDNVITAALTRSVDFVVFAGDLFDSSTVSYRSYAKLFQGFERLADAGIPAYLVTGNHDPYTSWRHDFFALPENVVLFAADRPDFALFERDGEPLCLVAGRGFFNHAWPQDVCIAEGLTRSAAEEALEAVCPGASAAPFSVGVLHTGLTIDPLKAPVSPSLLERAGMDYWALGHVHKRHVFPSLDHPCMAFSGCTQGRDVQETGSRGVFAVTLDAGCDPVLEFVPTASVVWQCMDVDVSDCLSLSAVVDKVMREAFRLNGLAHCEEMVMRVRLVGKTSLHTLLAREDILEDVRGQINESYPLFFCDGLDDVTSAPIDRAALREEGLFPSVFLSVSEAQRARTDDSVAFLQEEFLGKGAPLPRSVAQDVPALTQEAEELVLDLLMQGDRP